MLEQYDTRHRADLEPMKSSSFSNIPVLEFLWGRPWDDAALNYIYALRPSCIRVTTGEMTSDGVVWRVTVLIDKDRNIVGIDQSVRVRTEGAEHGHDLNCQVDLHGYSRRMRTFEKYVQFLHEEMNKLVGSLAARNPGCSDMEAYKKGKEYRERLGIKGSGE